jgi:hypothetical protein
VRAIAGFETGCPLIMKTFGLLGDTAADKRPENNPEPALLELRIMLLETWDLETIESWGPQGPGMPLTFGLACLSVESTVVHRPYASYD